MDVPLSNMTNLRSELEFANFLSHFVNQNEIFPFEPQFYFATEHLYVKDRYIFHIDTCTLFWYCLLFQFAIIYSFEVHSLHFMTPCHTYDTLNIFRDAVFNQFVNFWKPVVHLDTKIW